MMKKRTVKKYAEGGLAGLAETAESLTGDADDMANTINYGSSTPTMGNTTPFDPGAISTFKRGGAVKKPKKVTGGYVKKADDIAKKGKTRGRMV